MLTQKLITTMKIEQYREIKEYIRELTDGTEWEGYIYAVGGCVRDEIMGSID